MANVSAVMGAIELANSFIRTAEELQPEVEKAVNQAIILVESSAKESIAQGPKSGKVYVKKGSNSAEHQASAAGQAPANDTGNLSENIRTKLKRGKRVIGSVISKAPYSAALEFGTKDIKPRPFMRPALMNNERIAIALINKALKKAQND